MKALAVATGIVFWTLVLGIAWLALFPGSDAGEPVAILQVEPVGGVDAGAPRMLAPRPTPTQVLRSKRATSLQRQRHLQPTPTRARPLDMPPGFAVTAPGAKPQTPVLQPPSPGDILPSQQIGTPTEPPSPADAATPDGRQGTAEGGEQSASTAPAPSAAATPPQQQTAAVAPLPPTIPDIETGSGSLAPVPVAELVEESQYGPLPKVATDGRRPIDVYARPSRYAVKGTRENPRDRHPGQRPRPSRQPARRYAKGLPAPISVAYGAYGRNLQDWVDEGARRRA